MKRLISAVVLAALSLVLMVSVATAADGFRYRSAGLLSWRSHASTIVGTEGANYGVDADGGYVDSTSRYISNVAEGLDTTSVLMLPADFCDSGRDSLPPVVLVFRNTVAGASGDTVYAYVQPYLGGSYQTAANFIARAADPSAINKCLTGVATTGVFALYNAATAYAGSETMASTFPFNVYLVPALSTLRSFRVITRSDDSAAMTGNGRISCEVLYTVCR